MSKSLLEKYGEDYIRDVFKTANTVDEACEKLQTITKYLNYYAKELHCEEDYKRIKTNSAKIVSETLKKYPDAYINVKTSHGGTRVINDEVWLKLVLENKIHTKKQTILQVLIRTGYKENKCECCGINEWNGKPITLQLHHINGNPRDNRFENLMILCPNCHSQTDNYGSKNAALHINEDGSNKVVGH